MAASSSSSDLPPQHQVFINFRGAELRHGFVSHLVTALENHNIKVFIDHYADKGEPIKTLLTKIEESRIALAVLSVQYTESTWCLRELAMIKDCVEKGKLVAIPIFYKLDPSTVRGVRGQFGETFRDLEERDVTKKKEWKKALKWIPDLIGITVDNNSPESEKLNEIVRDVKKALEKVQSEGSPKDSVDPSENIDTRTSSGDVKNKTFGIDQRLKELIEKMDLDKYKGTRIIGVVGMPGIGKTTLLNELMKTWKGEFTKHALIDQIREMPNTFSLECLPTLLLKLPTELKTPQIDSIEEPNKTHKDQLRQRKVLVVLDDVSKREQIVALLGEYDLHNKHEWIKDGSRIVIATNDMSLLKGLVHDTYVVRQLNHRDSLQLFRYHAFHDDQSILPKVDFIKLSDEFVHYANGHPLALKILGTELCGNERRYWEEKLDLLAKSPNPYIGSFFQVSYNQLTSEQKDAFLDIACFRTQDVDYVESLLVSSDPESAEAIKALKNKFLIDTCDGRVEMHDLLYTFSRELDLNASSQDGSKQRRLWRHEDIIKDGTINVLQTTSMGAVDVRGIFLDLFEVQDKTNLDSEHLKNMRNLRYLKFYSSHCPHGCKTKYKINLPDKLMLPLKEVRCLHWLKFPLKKLPIDFNPINLVDLKLPYSEIKRLWDGVKDTPALKWVDLNHSSKLSSLSGLSKAQNLQRLNLEGCTSLESLGDVNLISLTTLTLSNCSNFKEFPLFPENLEALYLDGTAISQLTDNIVNLKRLVLLNMKDCKMLENIPTCIGELKALQKLVLSGCKKLKEFPEINKSSLKILLLDGTSIETVPLLPSVQYLCLSRNNQISYLPAGINQHCQLTWLDLKYCTSLTSVPELPPNLHYLDAHGCSSLKTVAKPLALIFPTVQNHCSFNFTNCCNLEQAAKEEITSYAQRRCQLLSYACKHYNGGLSSEALFSTCFPGCEVPSWFCHKAVGSLLQRELPPHWHEKKLSGLILCVVVSFLDGQEQISCFSVTCIFKIKAEDKSWIPCTCPVGSWTREGDKKDMIESDHVFIAYITCPHTIRFLEDENSNKCNSTEVSLEFSVTGGTGVIEKFKVLRCGLSLVYEKDKSKISSHEVKFDLPVEVSCQKHEGMIVDERRSQKPEGLIKSSVTQICRASVTPRMEDELSGQGNG